MFDSDLIDLNSVCRVCLSSAGDRKFLDDAYPNTQLNVADVYKAVTNIEFTDNMPKHICHDCFRELNQSYKYILKGQNSNKKILTTLDNISEIIIEDTQFKNVQTSKKSIKFLKVYVKSVVNDSIIGITNQNETQIVRSPSIESLKDPLATSELQKELEQNLVEIKNETYLETDKSKNNAPIYILPMPIENVDSNPKQSTKKSDTIQTTKTLKSTIKTRQNHSLTSKVSNKNTNDALTKQKVTLKNVNKISKSKASYIIKKMKFHNENNKKQKWSKLSGKNIDSSEMPDEKLKRKMNEIEINGTSTNTTSTSKIPEGNIKLRKTNLKSASILLNENKYTKTNSNMCNNNFDEKSKKLNDVIPINKIKKSLSTASRDENIEEQQKTPRSDNKRLTLQMKTFENKKTLSVICDMSFYKEANLHKHQFKHALDKPYACSICANTYKNKSALTKHVHTHSGEKPYKCSICTKAFTQKIHLSQHMSSHTDEQPYLCSHCDSKFKRKTNLIRHTKKHTGGSLYSCSVCKKAFSKKQFLMTHLLKHNGGKLFSCKNCGKSFSQKMHLTYHERTHTGERPHICTVCDKSFNQIANLNRHLLTHTEVKPYTCAICEWSFKEKSNLAKHVHIHIGEKLYTCEICASPFNKKANLTRHIRTHNE